MGTCLFTKGILVMVVPHKKAENIIRKHLKNRTGYWEESSSEFPFEAFIYRNKSGVFCLIPLTVTNEKFEPNLEFEMTCVFDELFNERKAFG